MAKVIQPHELSAEITRMMRDKFEGDIRIREMNVRASRLQQSGHYAECYADTPADRAALRQGGRRLLP